MSTIADKLTYLSATKTAIKSAIVNKGVSVSDADTFRSYADKIASIETGGGGGISLNIEYSDSAPTDTSKLWIKSAEPTNIKITPQFSASETLNSGVATLPTAANKIACAAVGTKIYLFGGAADSYLSTINVFDTTTNTISTLSITLPTAASEIACAAVSTKIYLFGGYRSGGRLNTINVFDTTTNTISTLSVTLSSATYSMACAAVGTKIYLFGGNSSSALNTINVFDTTSNTITTLSTTLPTAAYGMGCSTVGTKIYLFGGTGSSFLNTINVFDTTTNTISTLSVTLPIKAYIIACATIDTKIYLFGGFGSGAGRLNTINVFDTTTNTISTLSVTLPTAASDIACAAIGTKIYLFGGYSGSYLSTINQFIAPTSLTNGNILIVPKLTDIFDLISSDSVSLEIGIDNVYKGNSDNLGDFVDAYMHDGTNWVNVNTGEAYQEQQTEDPLAGTWVFNDSLDVSADIMWNVNYTTNSTEYTTLRISLQSSPMGQEPCMGTSGSAVQFYNMGAWNGEAYKTFIITSKLSEVTNGDSLLAWLQTNATKQEAGASNYTLTFTSNFAVTVNGTTVTSGYTLSNGDVIVINKTGSAFYSAKITYEGGQIDTETYGGAIPLDISNSDIDVTYGSNMSPSLTNGFTINFSIT